MKREFHLGVERLLHELFQDRDAVPAQGRLANGRPVPFFPGDKQIVRPVRFGLHVPSQVDGARLVGQGAKSRRVGCEFMECHSKYLGG